MKTSTSLANYQHAQIPLEFPALNFRLGTLLRFSEVFSEADSFKGPKQCLSPNYNINAGVLFNYIFNLIMASQLNVP